MNHWRPGRLIVPATFVEVVSHRAKYQAEELAFTFLTDGEAEESHLTFAELDRRARAIGASLQALDLEGERALLLFPPGLDFITAFFGCLYAGVVAVTAYPPRMNRSLARIDAIVADAQAKIALTVQSVLERIQPSVQQDPDLQRLQWLCTDQLPVGAEANWKQPAIDTETLAFLQYTSGSTGTPKGVMLTHGNLLHNSATICYGFDHARGNSGVFWLPSYHDMGLVGGILQPVFLGRPNVLMSPMAFLQKPIRWLRAISKYRASTSGGPNFAFDLCVRKISPEERQGLDLSSWRIAFNGAEPIRAQTLQSFIETYRPYGFRPESFYPCYGMAETTLIVTGGHADAPAVVRCFDGKLLERREAVPVDDATETEDVRPLVGNGAALPDLRTLIVDPDSRRPLPDGRIGEIWVQGPSVAQGYWGRPEETAATFHARVVDEQGRIMPEEGCFLRTGDLGFVDRGELYVAGRIKDLIIVHGVNHYPQDIELTMERSHPALRPNTAAAFALDTPGSSRLVVVQEVERTRRHECPEIIDAIRTAISREHELMVDAIVLIKPGSIPKTSSGKIQRFACREEFLKGALAVFDQWQLGDLGAPVAVASDRQPAAPAPEADPGGDAQSPRVAESAAANGEVVNGARQRSTGANGNGLHTRSNGAKILRKDGPASIERPAATFSPGPVSDPPAAPQRDTNGSPGVSQGIAGAIDPEAAAESVFRLIGRVAGDRARRMTIDSSLAELGLDSLERIELQSLIEEHFGGRIPEEVGPELETVREIIEAVGLYLGRGESRAERPPEVPEEHYRFDQFPEYVQLRRNLDLIDDVGLTNPFFRAHERVTADTTLVDGRELINFSSFNYIGMAGDAVVSAAAKLAIDRYGNSVSASRLVSGEKLLHQELERKLAELHGTDSAIVFPAGHATNVNTIGQLYGPGDLIVHDALAHNSIVTGAKLSGAKRRPFPHNDWRALDRLLVDLRPKFRRVLVAIEGAYSMDGDIADMLRFVEVKHRHKVQLLVDEAHSVGVLGATGRGVAEMFGLAPSDVDLWMGTLSKAFGSCGGYIAAEAAAVEYLRYTAPGFVFATGISPSNAAAALAAIQLMEEQPERVTVLRERSQLFLDLARQAGLNTGLSRGTPIVPIMLGSSIDALRLSQAMRERGVNVQPILYPAVDESAARLRFFLTSMHTEEQIRFTVAALAEEAARLDPKYVSHAYQQEPACEAAIGD